MTAKISRISGLRKGEEPEFLPDGATLVLQKTEAGWSGRIWLAKNPSDHIEGSATIARKLINRLARAWINRDCLQNGQPIKQPKVKEKSPKSQAKGGA
jgi:hypothetical protein